MAMKTLYFKEHEGIVHSPIGQLSPVAWWSSAFGSQSVNIGESCNLPTTLSMEPPTRENDQVTVAKHTRLSADQKGMHKGNTTHTIFPGDCKASGDGEKSPQSVISLQPPLPEYGTHFDFGFGQPMIYAAKYPLVDQCYGVFSAYAAQIPGRVMLPMNFSDEGPIYVNAKQYHGIMRRRKSRAKAVDENKMLTRNRKPYMHHSRHLHALRRPRGCGGRFLNSKELNDVKIRAEAKKICDFQLSQPTGSQGSEILQSGSGTSGSGGSLNSRKEVNGGGSNHSGSEVTSVYSRGAMDHFSFDLLCPPPSHTFPGIMDNGHDIVMPSKWVAAAAVAVGCCNQKD